MEKLIMTENLKLKRRSLNGEPTPMPISKSIGESLNDFETKAKESLSSVMLSSYNDLGWYGMTIDKLKPMPKDFNTKLETKVEESQDMFSSVTIAGYRDLGRYNQSIDK